MNDVIFNRGEGGLGRALTGEDHISGLLAYAPEDDDLSGLDGEVTKVFSIEDPFCVSLDELRQTSQFADDLYLELRDIFDRNPGAVVHVLVGLIVEGEEENEYEALTLSADILKLQRQSDGKIRQAGVILPSTHPFVVGHVTAIQSACDILEAEHKPLSVVVGAWIPQGVDNNIQALGTYPNLRTLGSKNVSVIIGGDGLRENRYYGAVGCEIGALSFGKVSENTAWVGKFDLTKNPGNRFDEPVFCFGNGTESFRNVPASLLDDLEDKGYIFLRKHVGKAGTYFNDTMTATAANSDYAFIENNRTMDKAVRTVRTYLLPDLNAPLYINPDGTLTEDTIATFRNSGLRGLEEMLVAGEISAKDLIINPAQNVLQSSKLVVTVKIVPVGVARMIEVNIGFAVKVSA